MTVNWHRKTAVVVVVSCLGCCLSYGCGDPSSTSTDLPRTSATPSEASVSVSPVDVELNQSPKTTDPRQSPDSSGPSSLFAKEAFVARATDQLRRIGPWLASNRAAAELSTDWIDGQFTCSPLRPTHREIAYRSHDFSVFRAEGSPDSARHTGWDGFRRAIEALRQPFAGSSTPQFSIHIYEVTAGAESVTTRVHVEIDGRGNADLVEQDAHWKVVWQQTTESGSPILKSIDIESFEEVHLHRDRPWFADCTESAFRNAESFAQQLAYSNTHWRKRIERHHIIDKSGHHGLAVGDINGDGLDDLYVCQPGGLPNRLYLRQSDGTVKDASAATGCDFLDNTRSALIIDFDNNGSQDLILATVSGILFLKNNGHGKMALANNITRIVDAYSLSAADYDHDGDLDIYACRYYQADADPLALPVPAPYFDAQNGGQNYLIQNDGNWRTSDATANSGLNINNNRFSYAAIWIDYDLDGDQDLYVANDFGRNNLYRNDSQPTRLPRFTDVALELGMEDGAFGMSAAGADFDRDGWEDIYVGNMFSSAGSRISRMPAFKPGMPRDAREKFQHLARGNTLFRNDSGRGFRDVSVPSGVTMGRWSWGALFADIDNNGWQDLIVANGYITGDKSRDDL